jgi:DNA-binding protein HU-beta
MSKAIPRSELIRRVAQGAGITNKAANTAINLIYEVLRETVGNQQSFVIPGVGTVSGRMRPEKWGRDPRNGNPILYKPKLIVKIKSYYKEKKGAE